MFQNNIRRSEIVFIALFTLLCIAFSHTFTWAAANKSVMPKWQIGDRWEVEVIQRAFYYREPGDHWLAPLHWQFEVMGIEIAREMQDESIEEPAISRKCFMVKVTNIDNPNTSQLIIYYDVKDLHVVRGEIHRSNGKIRLSKGDDYRMMPFNTPNFTALSDQKPQKRYCKALAREIDVINVEVEDTTYVGQKAEQQWSKSAPWWISYEKKDHIKAKLIGCSQ